MTDSKRSGQTDYELIDSISVAAFEVDGRIFRTIWHSIVRAPDVVLAAVKGDYTRYISPIRVLVALFGVQFAAAAIFGAPMTMTIESLSPESETERFTTWLNGADPDLIDRSIENVLSLLIWPIMIVSSLPYLILLKLYRPSLKFWMHVCVFLVPTNASTLVFVLLIPAFMLSENMMLATMGAMLAAYFTITGWLLARFYSRSILGTALRIGGFVLLFPLTFIISGGGQVLAVGWILDSQFGLNLLDLLQS